MSFLEGPGPDTGKEQIARRIVGTRLFLISYAPLWFAFLVLSNAPVQQIAFLLLTVYGVVDAFRLVAAGWRRSSKYKVFDSVSDRSGEVAGYLATYLLPFIAGPPTTWREWLAYGIYFAVAWAVFVPSDLGLINPTLYILGWRVVRASSGGHDMLVVCREPPRAGHEHRVARLMGGVGYVLKPSSSRPSPTS